MAETAIHPPVQRRVRWLALGVASLAGALGVAGLGFWLVGGSVRSVEGGEAASRWAGLGAAAGGWASRLSYDLLFFLRGPRALPEGRIVYLDEASAARLGQSGETWDRSIHARLVRRLTRDGARAVIFDVVFMKAAADPAEDADLAAAMAENGQVFLGAALELDLGVQAWQARTLPPPPVLRRAAAGWGLIAFRPIDADFGVRRLSTGLPQIPSATWRAAVRLGAPLPATEEDRAAERWLEYYGPADSFPSVSYDRALSEDELPPGFFRDQIVVVGGRSTIGTLLLGKDDFRTPYGLFGRSFAKGPEIHLTTLLNLLHGDWLRRLEPRWELALVLGWGLLLGGGLPWLRPTGAVGVALLAVAGWAVAALLLHDRERLWLAWIVPGAVQPLVALGWAVGARYFVEERRRRRLHEAFGRYLSPQMAARIADADVDLSPGGRVVSATVMFTDLENYSAICEQLDQPQRIARLLNTYFTRTIGHLLESDGTVIKYMGDAVQAVWGAPLPDPDQARKAVHAAWRLHLASRAECEGYSLRTRIGLHRGEVLAGNLGSAERFDFAVIGTPVNLASRFEGLNKYLGTDILLSESIRSELGREFFTRPLGRFRVAGSQTVQTLHELLGPAEGAPEPAWIGRFARALEDFQRGDFGAAALGFREVERQRPGGDRPAQFFLERIAALQASGRSADWSGVVEFAHK